VECCRSKGRKSWLKLPELIQSSSLEPFESRTRLRKNTMKKATQLLMATGLMVAATFASAHAGNDACTGFTSGLLDSMLGAWAICSPWPPLASGVCAKTPP
jgi:hypothetical protein